MSDNKRLPLDGITVVDFSRILAGPYCTMMLGDLGAEVLKIESPNGDDCRYWGPPFAENESAYFLAVNRNKKSLCIDLKTEGGRYVALELIKGADVVIENFRPGTMARLGFDYETLKRVKPNLVYCSISGYGQTGPLRERAGYDAVMQAEGGWMGLTGEPNGMPMKVGASLADIFTGMMASEGILAALYRREQIGVGEYIDVSLFDSVLSTLCYQAQGYLMTGEPPKRLGNRHSSLAPYEVFKTADAYVIVGVGNDALWKRFISCVNEPRINVSHFERNSDRVEHYDELRTLLGPIFSGRTTDEWIDLLDDVGIPVGRIRNMPEIFDNPQVSSRNMKLTVEHTSLGALPLTGNPIKMRDTNEIKHQAPPMLGEHTESVLQKRLGLDEETLLKYRANGVFGPIR